MVQSKKLAASTWKPGTSVKPAPQTKVRTTLRIPMDTSARVEYWSSKIGVTETDFMTDAIEEKIARMNGDYDLPTLEQARLAQILDQVKSLSVTNEQLEIVITKGFESLLGLARGDNDYLHDNDNGEIDEE